MQIKNIRLSFLILTGLVVLSYGFLSFAEEKSGTQNNIFLDSDQDGLSDEEEKTYGTDPKNKDTDGDSYSDGAEVKSGYDPKKPAPGDKIITETAEIAAESAENSNNLTKDVAKKISVLAASSNPEDKEMSLTELEDMIDESLHATVSEDELPSIAEADIKIKKQDYDNLSAEQKKEKEKEDFIDYITAVYYILSSNSPRPITSSGDIGGVISSISGSLVNALTSRNPKSVENLSASGEKILEQMKEVEVPEDLVDTHIKGLQFAYYSIQIKDYITPNTADPLTDIANMSKIQSLAETLMGFSAEVAEKFNEYGLDYNDTLKGKIENFGIAAPELEPEAKTEENTTANETAQ